MIALHDNRLQLAAHLHVNQGWLLAAEPKRGTTYFSHFGRTRGIIWGSDGPCDAAVHMDGPRTARPRVGKKIRSVRSVAARRGGPAGRRARPFPYGRVPGRGTRAGLLVRSARARILYTREACVRRR
jgi:hypothetical protein